MVICANKIKINNVNILAKWILAILFLKEVIKLQAKKKKKKLWCKE
jgi:hypothetical protein